MLTANAVIKRIDLGDDVEFTCRGKKYTILGWTDGGPVVSDVTTPESAENESQYRDGKDLLQRYMIDGLPLIKRIQEIKML